MQIRKLIPVSGIKRTLKQYNKISERQIVTRSVIYIYIDALLRFGFRL